MNGVSLRIQPLNAAQKPHPSPSIAMVVPVHNGLPYLRRCVESFAKTVPPGSGIEVVFVDDASGPETQSFLTEQQSIGTVIRQAANLGFSTTCNRGAAETESEWLFFANSDLEFPSGWVDSMRECIDQNPTFDAFGFRLLYADGTVQHAGIITLEDPLNLIPFSMYPLHVGAPADTPQVGQPQELTAVTAAAFLVRRSAFESVGGFDTQFFNGAEDIDLCLRLKERGFRILYWPGVTLFHHESKSGSNRWLKTLENQRLLAERWVSRIDPDAILNDSFGLESFDRRKSQAHRHIQTVYTVVVFVENDLAQLMDSLDSIRANLGLFQELIVVDLGSTDGSLDLVRQLVGRDLRMEVIETIGLNRWEALAQVCEPRPDNYVVTVSGSTVVGPGWLPKLSRNLARGIDAVAACTVVGSLVQAPNPGVIQALNQNFDMKSIMQALSQTQAGKTLAGENPHWIGVMMLGRNWISRLIGLSETDNTVWGPVLSVQDVTLDVRSQSQTHQCAIDASQRAS